MSGKLVLTSRRPIDIDDFFNEMFNAFDIFEKDLNTKMFKPSKVFADNQSFPRYNIVDNTHFEENSTDKVPSFVVELALAGYKKDDLYVRVKQHQLRVSTKDFDDELGCFKDEPIEVKPEKDYYVKGITTKSFFWHFALPKDAEVKNVEMSDGILRITVDLEPIHEEYKTFEIK